MDKPPHAAGRTAGRVTGDGWQVTGLRRASTWQAGFGKTGSIEHSTFNIQHRIEGEPASAARRQVTGGWWRIARGRVTPHSNERAYALISMNL